MRVNLLTPFRSYDCAKQANLEKSIRTEYDICITIIFKLLRFLTIQQICATPLIQNRSIFFLLIGSRVKGRSDGAVSLRQADCGLGAADFLFVLCGKLRVGESDENPLQVAGELERDLVDRADRRPGILADIQGFVDGDPDG